VGGRSYAAVHDQLRETQSILIFGIGAGDGHALRILHEWGEWSSRICGLRFNNLRRTIPHQTARRRRPAQPILSDRSGWQPASTPHSAVERHIQSGSRCSEIELSIGFIRSGLGS